jgi:hypothetical protein
VFYVTNFAAGLNLSPFGAIANLGKVASIDWEPHRDESRPESTTTAISSSPDFVDAPWRKLLDESTFQFSRSVSIEQCTGDTRFAQFI